MPCGPASSSPARKQAAWRTDQARSGAGVLDRMSTWCVSIAVLHGGVPVIG
ncbi:Inositol-1-monophosphatase (plasmid) [Sinorhizobium fredii CCBAU 25509]|nr:Inositol-1-monophosphatase [Sinorhizobium fredii CCBAU 83666]AWM29534.1 Inositol-1-monophosphatase [Sinorhizobium fredii CCBAU 25509]